MAVNLFVNICEITAATHQASHDWRGVLQSPMLGVSEEL